MTALQDIIVQFYKPANNAGESVPEMRFTNRDLVEKFIHLRDPLRLSAAIFLRPASAMQYRLLPALSEKLAYQKPVPNSNAEPARTPEESIVRSLSMLLEMADPSWTELPDNWVSLGAVLDKHDVATAREMLDIILNDFYTDKPMSFLRKFCRPMPEESEWLRHFSLSQADLDWFMNRESVEALKRIEEADKA